MLNVLREKKTNKNVSYLFDDDDDDDVVAVVAD